MAEKRDYYEVLGISRNADEKTIKKAYRKIAKKYHPDTNPGDAHAEQMFKEAGEAYEVLSDPEKRKMYDQYGHMAFDTSGAGFHSQRGPEGSYQEYHFDGSMDDIFGDIFGNMFHGSRAHGFNQNGFHESHFYNGGFQKEAFKEKGADLNAEVEIRFEEAVFGCEKVIHLQGSGGVQSLKVRIPAGIESGKSIRLRGKGMPGSRGGEAGDLFLKVNVAVKNGFERKGMDVYTTVNVPFATAVLGGEVMIETLYGKVRCKIKPGTQSGTKIRLRGKGIVSMKDASVHGDQYATVQIQVPKNLSTAAIQKLKEFREACA